MVAFQGEMRLRGSEEKGVFHFKGTACVKAQGKADYPYGTEK